MNEDVDSVAAIPSSEAIIADLLNDVKASEHPFSVDKLAGCDETMEKRSKSSKSHKHKSQKKKRRSSRERSRSRDRSSRRRRSRTRSRSRERSRKEKKKSKNDDVEPDTGSTLEDDFKTPLVVKKTSMEISITTVLPKEEKKVEEKSQDELCVEDGEIADIAYGLDTEEPQVKIGMDKDKEKVEEKEEEKKKDKEKSEKNDNKRKKKEKSERKRSSSRKKSSHRRRSRSRTPSRTRSRSRSRDRRRRSPRDRHRSHKSRSRSRERPRDREEIRRRERREYDDYRRRRSRSREIIDKEKLLAIAKNKRAEMMSNGDRDNASIEDFVTYCKKLQKRQEREKRREAGQAVSDHDSDGETVRYKHPYAMPKEPIRINIVNATSLNLAQKALMAPEETTQLDASQLRIVFPVSSGAVHKENAEWIPVQKDDVPKSCSTVQKNHVALTSLEIDRCRAQGIPIAPVAVPKFLDCILPPPPPPPQFMPNISEPFRPPTPPPLPSVLYVPQKDRMIIREPEEIKIPEPKDIGKVLKQRTEAQKKLYSTPNDFEAHRALREANEQIELWAALKSLPGEYTGTTGLKLLTADELQPQNPKYHAWVKRDQFKNAAPATGGIGRLMMEKMGWKEGEGLGREKTGNVEPLVLDVKSDRKGLIAEEEMSIKQRNKLNAQNNVPVDLSSKNPISLLMELCAKRRWKSPTFLCEDTGADHLKMFVWTVIVNDVEYRPMTGSRQKKEGKAVACQIALQSLGVLPRDPEQNIDLHYY